jgi:hypothetical protein
MLATWMVMSALDLDGSAPSIVAVPSHSLNAPRTLVTIACRATKPRRLCAVSMA